MEKTKIFFNKKDGKYGVRWVAKVEIKEAGTYFIDHYEEIKDGKFGQYHGGSIVKYEPQEQQEDKQPF